MLGISIRMQAIKDNVTLKATWKYTYPDNNDTTLFLVNTKNPCVIQSKICNDAN